MTTLDAAPSGGVPHGALDASSPWPGLEAFREEDAAFFRGRDAEAEALWRHLHLDRLTVLFGQSGLGKSSLLQAGIFPRARAGHLLPVHIRLVHDESASPLRIQVLEALSQAAAAQDLEAPPADPEESLWEHFHRQGSAYWSPDNQPVTPLLVFDQFEEVFTVGRATPERNRRTTLFLEELGDLIEGRPSLELKKRIDAGATDRHAYNFTRHGYRVLLGIREDFLAELEGLRERIPSVKRNWMRLTPLRGDAALLVTAAGGPVLVPEGVGERIVRLVAGESEEGTSLPLDKLEIDPALLSLFCSELNERRQSLGRDSITADLVEGSREQILGEYYERSVGDLGDETQRFVEDRLLTVTGFRNSEALDNALAQPGVTPAAIDALIARRLIRREDRDRRTRIELTHDVLTGVVRASRERRLAEERLRAEEEERRRQEQAEKEELQAREAAARAAVTIARARLRTIALGLLVSVGLAAAAVVLAARADAASREARRLTEEAISARRAAEAARDTTQRALAQAERREREALLESDIADRLYRQNALLLEQGRLFRDSILPRAIAPHLERTRDLWGGARGLDAEVDRAETIRKTICVDGPRGPDSTAFVRVRAAIDFNLQTARLEGLCSAP